MANADSLDEHGDPSASTPSTTTTTSSNDTAQQSTGVQLLFLAIVTAIILSVVIYPGLALGVFYPPCSYGGINHPIVTVTPPSTPPTVAPVVASTPIPVTPVTTEVPLPASAVTATAQARDLLDANRTGLELDTITYSEYSHCLASFNGFIDYTVKFLSILFAVITTIASVQQWRLIGFISGALVTAMTAFQTTFPMEIRATFYQGLGNRVDTLVADVRYALPDEKKLQDLRIALDNIKQEAANGPNARAVPTQTVTPTQPSAGSLPPTGAVSSGTPSAAPGSGATVSPSPSPSPAPSAPTATQAPGEALPTASTSP